MNVLTLIIYIGWFLSEIFINRLMRSKKQDRQNKDKSSLGLIWLTIAVSITLSVFIEMNYRCPIARNWISYVGQSVIIIGIVFRLVIIRSLGAFFTADVTICENHTLKTDGFYKFLRHPSYAASLLSFVGFGIALNNWISVAVITGAIAGAFIYRITVEETALSDYFGQQYADYKKATWAMIPFIF